MVLDDHIKKKKKLIPPFLQFSGDGYAPYSWSIQLAPELIWLPLLYDNIGVRRGIEVATSLSNTASSASKKEIKPFFSKLSSYLELTDSEKEEILEKIPKKDLDDLKSSIAPISEIWPGHPLSFISNSVKNERDAALDSISPLLQDFYDRRSRTATLSIATAIHLGMCQGKIFVLEEVAQKLEEAFSNIDNYPKTEASKKAGTMMRAMAPAFLFKEEGVKSGELSEWGEQFWEGISSIGNCIGDYQDTPILPDSSDSLEDFRGAYTHFAHKDLKARQDAWPLDLKNSQSQQIIFALLARQATLSIEIISSPSIWNPNVAPILLRAMADVHITLVWLLGDIDKRVPLYVADGLGAVKLEIAHRQQEIEKNPSKDTEDHKKYTEFLTLWLESQSFDFLVEVNLGSWSGKSTRVMAQEAGCLDFYNYVFQPFSANVHSQWHLVGHMNVEYCKNPAHNFHFLPAIKRFEPDIHWCLMSAKYFRKTLTAFDEFIKNEALGYEAFDMVFEPFNKE